MSTPTLNQSAEAGGAPYACPQCGREFVVQSDAQESLVRCDGCGEQFFLPQGEFSSTHEDDEAGDQLPPAEELDGLRIRQHASLKRSLYRSRSYAIVLAVGFGLIIGHVLVSMVNELRMHGVTGWVLFYSVVIALSGLISVVATRRALALHREASSSAISEPAADPDFSTLSDGTQITRDLHDIK